MPDPSSTDPTGSCEYEGRTYQNGAVICVGGTQYSCTNGNWNPSGRCSPDDEVVASTSGSPPG